MNLLYVVKQIKTEGMSREEKDGVKAQLSDIEASLAAMFGTPDEPYIVEDAEIGVTDVIDPALLPMAAGPVGRDENGFPHGLYRRHCVHCHGVTGDGAGPTAQFLNPYPRDFRMGKFKFKSTPTGAKPTDDDLRRTLTNGIQGTAMPSFKVLLAEDEMDAMINYVKYLSIRGEVERKLIDEVSFLEPDEQLDTSKDLLVDEFLAEVVDSWKEAGDLVTKIQAPSNSYSAEKQAAIDRGRKLFHGKDANCFSCHGATALGDGQGIGTYDDWTNEFADWNNLQPDERRKKMAEYEALTRGLTPRRNPPRNLRSGVYRGGRRPIDLYRRIKNGIEGAPMPAALMKPPGQPNQPGLTEEDIWDIIAYVQNLPYEPLSQPPEAVLENLRENP